MPPPRARLVRPDRGNHGYDGSAWALALHVVFAARRDELLLLDVRKRLYDQVCTYPGLHLRELARATGLDPNHAKYHLTYLEKHDLLSSRKEDGYWRFYAKADGTLGQDSVSPAEKNVLALLRKAAPLHLTLLLLERGTVPVQELSGATGLARSTLYYHLGKMEKAGFVVPEMAGRERAYRLAEPERMLDVLMRYKPPDALVAGFLEAWEALEI